MKQQLTRFFADYGTRFNLRLDEPMARHTSFRVGGPADLFAEPETSESMEDLLKLAAGHGIPVTFVGGGTNLLVKDKGIRGLVVCFSRLKGITSRILEDSAVVSALAGTRLPSLVRYALDNGFSGLVCAAGIPGTVGGGVSMNAGTAIGTVGSVVESLTVIGPSLSVSTVSKTDLVFSRRHLSILFQGSQGNWRPAILEATFRLKKETPETLKEQAEELLRQRQVSQPAGVASAGCFFKNPEEGEPAGKLIDRAGLKGERVGGAMVSDVHANYIVNTGNATAGDILALSQIVIKKVMTKYNITLEPEVKIEGE